MLAPGCQVHTGLREKSQRAFYSNGWQSWNWTATYGSHQPSRRTRLSILEAPMYINPTTPQPRGPGHYTADFFGVLADRDSRLGWLAGFLSQKQQFGALEGWLTDQPALRLWASGDSTRVEVGRDMITDLGCAPAGKSRRSRSNGRIHGCRGARKSCPPAAQ